MAERRRGRTLHLELGAFIAALFLIVALAICALLVMDATRAYTMGESLYTKGQKEAVIALQRYARTGDASDFWAYRRAVEIPLGDRAARRALAQEPPDLAAAREGFLRGGNDPGDVPAMILMFRLFGDTFLFERPRAFWRRADEVVMQITGTADELRTAVSGDEPDSQRRDRLLAELGELNRRASRQQAAFSDAVRASAWAVRNLAAASLVLVAVLLALALSVFALRLYRRNVAAELSLVAGEERLRVLMNSTGDGILSTSGEGRITMANIAAERMFGWSRDELVSRNVRELVTQESLKPLRGAMEAAPRTAGDTITPVIWQLRGLRRDGSSFPLEMLCAPVDGSAAAPMLVFTLRDVSERELVEARLFQAQKMETVGELTAGIAHNFNNLLTVVIGSLESLRDDRSDDEDRAALINSALDAADRSAELTSHLLAFSRRQPLMPGPVDVNALITQMRELLEQSVPASIELQCRLAPGVGHAIVDHAHLESALLNLVLNAVHAIDRSGTIRVETERLSVRGNESAEVELPEGDYAVIRVSDTGCGIAPEDLPRVFEPFFTTREAGAGTGLGLSMVHGFVKQSGGQVLIDSALGEGTRIELLLPVSHEAPPDQ